MVCIREREEVGLPKASCMWGELNAGCGVVNFIPAMSTYSTKAF